MGTREQRRRHDNNKTFSLDNQKCEATAMVAPPPLTPPPSLTTTTTTSTTAAASASASAANTTNGKGQAQATIGEMANAFKLFAYNMDLECNSASNTQKMYTERNIRIFSCSPVRFGSVRSSS